MASITISGLSKDKTCLISNVVDFMNELVKQATKNGTTDTFGDGYTILYHSTKIPKFSATSQYNPNYNIRVGDNYSKPPTYTNLSKPEAIMSSDLDSTSSINTVTAPQKAGQIMTASTIINALITIVAQVSRVHRFTSTWRHREQNTDVTKDTFKGTGIFKKGLTTVSEDKTKIVTNKSTSTRGRTVPSNFYDTPSLGSNKGVEAGGTLSAANLQAVMNDLYTKWISNIAKTINYTIFSCHYNCHSNCHGSRGRR